MIQTMPDVIETTEEKKELSPEEEARQNLARKRIFYTLVGLTAAIVILIAWAVIEHFVG